MKILLPADGSDCALRAVEQLIVHSAWFREAPDIPGLHVPPAIPSGRVQAHLGTEAVHAYDRATVKLKGRLATTNFPVSGEAWHSELAIMG